jgi:Holliday junction resolvasome RuvABC endonuclease subunit
MRVLGLDPSLTGYGWAYLEYEEGVERCVKRGRWKTKSKTVFIDRYVSLREALRQQIREDRPDFCGIEYPIFHDTYSEGMYGLFLYSCEALRAEKLDVLFLANNQAKAYAKRVLDRPSGWKMGKADMIEAAKRITGVKARWTNDEADAFIVAVMASRFWLFRSGGLSKTDLTAYEKRVFVGTKRKKKSSLLQKKSGLLHREGERFYLWSKSNPEGD